MSARSRKPAKLKVVLDTSVCVAAILSKAGGSARVFEAVVSGKIYNFFTHPILDEVNRVLHREKFGLAKENTEHFIHLFSESSFQVMPLQEFQIVKCRDPKDDMFLSLANQVEADYLVTLDLDLLDLKSIRHTRIVTPSVILKKNLFRVAD